MNTAHRRHPQQDSPNIPYTESNHKNKTNDENSVGNFITWLTTPPTITPPPTTTPTASVETKTMEKMFRKETTEKQELLLPPTPSRQQQQQPSSPSRRSPSIVSLSLKRQRNKEQDKPKPKEFGELVSIHIPDLERTLQNTSTSNNTSNIINNIIINSNNSDDDDDAKPHLHLPSHVPTPDTLDSNDHHYCPNGLHHHLQSIIFQNRNNKNNDAVDHTNHHKGMEIRYAPNPITPPQSPSQSSKKKKTLAIPKWGPDFWNSKKRSLLASSGMDANANLSCSSLAADDSSDSDDCYDSSTSNLWLLSPNTEKNTNTKRPSSPSSVMDCDITNAAAFATATPPPLQLRWMHENALNIQSMRDSIRYCGDDDVADSSVGVQVQRAQHHSRHEELEGSMLFPRSPSLLELATATMDE